MNLLFKMKHISFSLCVFTGVCFLASYGNAQTAIDQSRSDRIYQDRREFFDRLQTARPQKIIIPESDTVKVESPPGSDQILLQLSDLKLEASSIYNARVLRKIYQDYLGRVISLEDIFIIAQKMTEQYHKDGYVLSRVVVPEQEIDQKNAVVTLKLIEGKIDRIAVSGVRADDHFLRSVIDAIKTEKSFNAKELEKKILMLNQSGDRSVQAFLKPITDRPAPPGAIDLEFILNDQPVLQHLTLDNFGSKYSGPWNASWTIFGGGLIKPFDAVTINSLVSLPLNEVGLVNVNYSLPIHQNGLSLNAHLDYTRSEPGKELEDLEIKSKSFYGGVGFSYPWFWTRQTKIKSSLDFDFNQSRSESLSALLTKDGIRAMRVTTYYEGYTSQDSYQTAQLKFSKGLDLLGARKTGSDDLSRAEGRSDFTKIELELSRNQALGKNIRARAEVEGQYAFDPLLSSEEFGVGGAQIGRGYDASEIIGDRGVAMSFELSHQNITPDTKIATMPYVFYDIGKVWNIDKASSDQKSIASTGVGMRLQNEQNMGVDMFIAKPLTAVAGNRAYGAGRDLRAYIRLQTEF